MLETTFMRNLLLALGRRPELRVWRQNNGVIPIRDGNGKTERYFDTGIPNGAADISGIVIPYGWRIEVETKMQKGKVSQTQLNWAKMITEAGGIYVLARYDNAFSLEENVSGAVVGVLNNIQARKLRGT